MLQGPVFLLNSWLNHFAEAYRSRLALSRSYSHNLPSSFSTAHPSALEYSSRLPVSVYGTGRFSLTLEGFLGGYYLTQSSRSSHILSHFAKPGGFACQAYSYVLKRGIPYPSCECHFRVAPSKLKRVLEY